MKKKDKYIDCKAVSLAVTVVFILLGVFRFNGFLGRIIESVRDLGLSAAYYFCDVLEISSGIVPTVNDYPKIPFFGFMGGTAPTIPIPKELERFIANWGVFWKLFVERDNFVGYLGKLGDILLSVSRLIIVGLPFIIVFRIVIGNSYNKQNNDYNVDSKPLKAFKRFVERVCRPCKNWVVRYIAFVRERRAILYSWLVLWLLYFNAFTIVIEGLAYYMYFVVSFDVVSLYKQLYKLLLDLWALLTFFPLAVWIAVTIAVLSKVSRSIGYSRLRHNEAKNCGVVNERGVVTIVYGVMGEGKTALITDMTLTENNLLRDQAFEIILESDLKFKDFPWINLENELKRAIRFHEVFSILTVNAWIEKKKTRFGYEPSRFRIFDYEYEKYPCTYDDGLKVYDIWEVLAEYACAYLIYTVQTSYIISNYSIRSDTILCDVGNFPLYNKDFFERDSRLQESYSRRSHILDFDMLRLGKVMLEENPNRYAFGFGVYVISEIDKERKNAVELQEVKRNTDECNQKNDLFNTFLKMSRQPCVLCNRVFLKVFGDLQRPSSLGGDARELGQVICIESSTGFSPVLPVWSPFYLLESIYLKLIDNFNGFYSNFRYNRGDNTLFVNWYKNIVGVLFKHYKKVYNTFGCASLELSVEAGTLDGQSIKRTWYKMPKKVYSNRYSTDCYAGVFDKRGEFNQIGIDDLKEFAGSKATWEELELENSFFIKDLKGMSEKAEAPTEKKVPPKKKGKSASIPIVEFGSDVYGLEEISKLYNVK